MHNKLKKKDAELPADVVYMAGEDVPPMWNCYPCGERISVSRFVLKDREVLSDCSFFNMTSGV